MYEMNHSRVKEEMKILSVDVTENIKIENENTYEPELNVKSDMDIKQTWENLYDSSFTVCKEELFDNPFKSEILSEKIVDTLHPVTELGSVQQCEELTKCVTLESSNSYLVVDLKLDHSLQHELKSEECTQALGSSAETSMKRNNFQRNKTSLGIGDFNIIGNYRNTPLTSKDTHVCDINTNINNVDDNFEVKTDLENQWSSQTVSVRKRKTIHRHSDDENLESFSEKINVSPNNKNKMIADINEPAKKLMKAVHINDIDKWNRSLEEVFINDETSSSNNIETSSTLQNVSFKNYANVMCMKKKTSKKLFSCNICHSKFTRKDTLVSHMRTHTGEKPFSCDICNYKCSQKSHLAYHMKAHTGEKPFSCHHCHSKFGRKYVLVRHMRTHTGEKPFSCNLCNIKFSRKKCFITHKRAHTGEKPFSCDICKYKCSQKCSLTNHMRTHSGEKPFSCNICEYKCSRNIYLTYHMTTHTGEKPFSCHVCNSKFVRKYLLVRHMRTHTGEKPFSCDICNYKCNQKGSLTSHMRTHTGEKPFSCNICECKFSHKGNLMNHLRAHSGEKPSLL